MIAAEDALPLSDLRPGAVPGFHAASDSLEFLNPAKEKQMNWMLLLSIALVVFWVVARALGWMLGVALHLFWIAAVVLFVIWLIQKFKPGA